MIKDSALATVLQATGIFLGIAGAFVGGVIAATEHPVQRCPSYHLQAGRNSVLLLTEPSGSDGVTCIMVRGYFEGDPSQWRYLSPLQ